MLWVTTNNKYIIEPIMKYACVISRLHKLTNNVCLRLIILKVV